MFFESATQWVCIHPSASMVSNWKRWCDTTGNTWHTPIPQLILYWDNFQTSEGTKLNKFPEILFPRFYLNMKQPLCKKRKKRLLRHVLKPYRWVQHIKVNIAYNSTTPLSSPSLRVCGENKRIIKFSIISCMREMAVSSGNTAPNDEWQPFWLLRHGQGPSQRSRTHTRPRCC